MQQDRDFIEALTANLQQVPKHAAFSARKIHFITGSQNAGKTLFMMHSGFQHIQTLTNEGVEINSWHDKQNVFLELPESIKKSTTLYPKIYKALAKSLKQKQLASLTVCFNIYDAMQQPPKPFVRYLKQFATFLFKLTQPLKHKVNLNLLFSHMDKIAGFSHSFEDPTEPWGYSFKPYINHASLLKQNSTQFEQLLKNLHNQLIEKLHRTDDKLTKYLIREFPLQMESVGNLVKACVNHTDIPSARHSHVLFCSSKQSNSATDRLTTNISQTYNLAVQNQIPQSSLDKTYFVEGALKRIINSSPIIQQRAWQHNPLMKYGSAAVVMIAVIIGGRHYQNQRHIEQAFQAFSAYDNSDKTELSALISALSHLSDANQSVKKLPSMLNLSNTTKFNQSISNKFQTELSHTLLPLIAQHIEAKLTNSKKPADLYKALKAYIMLGNANVLNKPYLISYIKSIWQPQAANHQQQLEDLLKQSLQSPYQGIAINQRLIESSQSYLNALPNSFLAFKIIEAQLPTKSQQLELSHFNSKLITIPAIYQRQHFKTIYEQQLPKLAQALAKEQFVLSRPMTQISSHLQSSYLKHYQRFWQKLSTQLRPDNFQSYQQGAVILKSLASNNSSIDKLFSLIQLNTAPFASNNISSSSEQAFNQAIGQSFSASSSITNEQMKQLQTLLTNLAEHNQHMAHSNQTAESAFNLAKARFTNANSANDPISELTTLTSKLPFPINGWLKSLATNSWYLVLNDSQQYIRAQWQQQVYKPYQSEILNRFPFSKDAKQEVTKRAFIAFFNPKGQLKRFFDEYLAPFIDTNKAQWQAKVQDELQLPISEAHIKELIRANVIRDMFFKNNLSKPQLRFTLHMLTLEPMIEQLSLTLNGQQLEESQQYKRSKEFVWPGSSKSTSSTTLAIKNSAGEIFEQSEPGFWGWFKLLNKSSLQPYGNDLTNFQLVMNINGSTSKFLMVTDSQLNPFIPGVLENFKLPEQIT